MRVEQVDTGRWVNRRGKAAQGAIKSNVMGSYSTRWNGEIGSGCKYDVKNMWCGARGVALQARLCGMSVCRAIRKCWKVLREAQKRGCRTSAWGAETTESVGTEVGWRRRRWAGSGGVGERLKMCMCVVSGGARMRTPTGRMS